MDPTNTNNPQIPNQNPPQDPQVVPPTNLPPTAVYYQQEEQPSGVIPTRMDTPAAPAPQSVPVPAPVAPVPAPEPEPAWVTNNPNPSTGESVLTAPPLPEEPTPVAEPVPTGGGKLKKILFIVVGLLVLLGIVFLLSRLFTAGGSKKTNVETVVTWWGLWDEDQVIKPLIDEYQTQNPTVKVVYVRNSSKDYRERLTNALAKGEGPDIFRIHDSWVPMLGKEIEPVPSSVMSAADITNNYYPSIYFSALGDSFAGLPMMYDGLQLFVNEDIFTAANLEIPTTWFELRDAAKQLTKVDNGVIVQAGVALGEPANVDHWQDIIGLMLLQNKVDINLLTDQKTQDVLKFFSLFSKNYGVWDKSLPSSTAYFASGKLAMYFGPSWRALNIKELNPKLKFKAVPLPQLPKASPSDPDISYASYWIDSVWQRSPNKDAAWDFLKFISSRESLEKIYQNANQVRGLGSAYPYADMAPKLADHTILGSLVQDAKSSDTWYLASRTFDGTTGINSQISKYFEDALNSLEGSGDLQSAVETVAAGVAQVKSQYGIK